ncbi:ubiquitin carboxyl-terminal hydrolase 47-like isoform X2 [Corticium candelabrum]|uniref:ubiquitin carboxyl-terminal hydrolase 47-like isoform X2 n=1 Tax=Corticium candelabrum TaxID=121492 RepID=UPI002E258EA6|nr:ubiquitin carboxyl-terminal hydrolase 47-like isoform X2 [Corticium candelabrum]
MWTFIIELEMTSDKNLQSTELQLPPNWSVSQLYQEVAKIFGLVEESFDLLWNKGKNEDKIVDKSDPELTLQVLLGLNENVRTVKLLARLLSDHEETLDKQPGEECPVDKHKEPLEDDKAVQEVGECEEDLPASTSTAAATAARDPLAGATSSSTVSRAKPKFVGLVNQGATCYLNSLLQTLYMTPEFRNALCRFEFVIAPESEEMSIPFQLKQLFYQLQNSGRSVSTVGVTKSFGWDSSKAFEQDDVHQLYQVMFDALEQELVKTNKEDLISRLYEGKRKDYVTCWQCGLESANEESFHDILLGIKPFGSITAFRSVEESMDSFVRSQTLDGDNQYYCDNCQRKCRAEKGLKFTSFPYLLTLLLKRFDFDYWTMKRVKVTDRMTFPVQLNLNKYIDSECSGQQLNGGADEGDDTTDTSSHMPEASASSSNNSQGPYVYELFSILVHTGSAYSGHYYAYIRSFSDNQWYCFNDQTVSKVREEDIRSTFGEQSAWYTSSKPTAYMLMYRQTCQERNEDFLPSRKYSEGDMKEEKEAKNEQEQDHKEPKNEQEQDHVKCKVTEEDIESTFGEQTRYGYTSLNPTAYMLMYRQKCKERNEDFLQPTSHSEDGTTEDKEHENEQEHGHWKHKDVAVVPSSAVKAEAAEKVHEGSDLTRDACLYDQTHPLEAPVRIEFFAFLCKHTVGRQNWRLFAEHLHLSQKDIENIASESMEPTDGVVEERLRVWLQNLHAKTSISDLLVATCCAGWGDWIELIAQYVS